MKPSTTLAWLASLALATASSFKPARPPSIPLAVKSPYMSTHLEVAGHGENGGGYLTRDWARFYQHSVSAWVGLVRVDDKTYCWMGNCESLGFEEVKQEAFTYTATRSIFTMRTPEGVRLTITFMSPIYPKDYKRHSQTATYLHVHVRPKHRKAHHVKVYSDISAEWIAKDVKAIAEWKFGLSNDSKVATHNVFRQTQLLFTEDEKFNGAIAQWGNWLWSTKTGHGMSWQSGPSHDVRKRFETDGSLTNKGDTNFRAIEDNWPVFAFAQDLGRVGNRGASTLFTIGLYQQEAIQFHGKDGIVSLPAYWTNFWKTPEDAAAEFIQEYSYAAKAMTKTDNRIHHDAVIAAGKNYAAIVELAYRQSYGGIQIVGTPEKNYIFMKEISSDGNVATVDVIFPAFPVFAYDNPDLIKRMLDPLFENQEAGGYPNKWAEHDIGGSYPNATGHNDGGDERMSVEEPGNMLIMMLAYAQRSKDVDYLKQHYSIMKRWNEYLVDAALAPVGPDSLSTDDFAGPHDNQTNLALKGIIGIAAMAEIAHLTGNQADSHNLRAIAEKYIGQWQDLGINKKANPPHTTFTYGDQESHGLLYNLYADKLLRLKLVPQSVYDMQSKFYQTVGGKYGVPLDTRWGWTKLDWQMWCAAYSSHETRDYFHKRILKWIGETDANGPLTDLYQVKDGGFANEKGRGGVFMYRPVVGGLFALLALPREDWD